MARYAPIMKRHQLFWNSDKIIRWHIWNKDMDDFEDIGGWTLGFDVAITQGGDSLFSKTVTIEDSTTGLVKVDIDPSDTVALSPNTYYYTLARTNTGLEDVAAYGEFVLQPRVNT